MRDLRGVVSELSIGDQLRVEVETQRWKGEIAQVRGVGTVAGKVVCEAVLTFTLVEP